MKKDRQQAILDYISTSGPCSVTDLSAYLHVSVNTIRRDIDEMCHQELIVKRYGSVQLFRKNGATYKKRFESKLEEKKIIAEYCASKVQDNDLIFIDSGTSAGMIMDYLPENLHLTIFTNNLVVVEAGKDKENFDIHIVGTQLKHSSYSFIHVQNWNEVNSVNLNKAFLGTTGFTLTTGATNPDYNETEIKSHVMDRSVECYLMCDSSKFGAISLYTFAAVDAFKEVVTTGKISKTFTKYFSSHKLKLTIL